MSKLKKANVRKKSDRALERERQLAEEEEKLQQEKEKQKKRSEAFKKSALDAMLPLYTLLCAILGFLFSQIGVFSLIGIVLGIIALKRMKGAPKDRYFWIATVSLAVCVICGGYWLISIGYILINRL